MAPVFFFFATQGGTGDTPYKSYYHIHYYLKCGSYQWSLKKVNCQVCCKLLQLQYVDGRKRDLEKERRKKNVKISYIYSYKKL